jgi:hypothetical protein
MISSIEKLISRELPALLSTQVNAKINGVQ